MNKKGSKKIELIPAILEKNFSQIEKKIKRIAGQTKYIQVDICDGKFVPSKTIASAGRLTSFLKLKKMTVQKINLELDLMINWDTTIQGRFKKWLIGIENSGAQRIILHLDSTQQWERIFNFIKKSKKLQNIEIGLAVQIQHQCQKDILPLLKKYPFKFVQFMGIEKIGYGGQKLTPKVFKKIKKLRKLKKNIPISIDGGVKIHNTQQLITAGATRLVSGSGLFSAPDIKKQIKIFLNN